METSCHPKCARSAPTPSWRFGIGPGREASLSTGSRSDGPHGQELEDIFGGAGSGRVGLRIWNGDSQLYWRTFSIFFSYSVFRVPVADYLEFEL